MPVITNVNIKELPVLEEIKNGDLLLVETDKGTQTIDFANFVVGPDNVNFYNEVISLSSGIITTNNSLQTTTRSISTSIQDYVNAKAASMSATVVSQYSKIFYQSGQLTFPVGATVSNSVVITLPVVGMTIGPENVNLTFNSTVVPALTQPFGFEGKFYVVKVQAVLPVMAKEFNESKGNATSDYQNALEKDWIESLQKKYKVKINKKVLYNLGKS